VEPQTTWIAVAAGTGLGLLVGILFGRRAGRTAARRARDLEDQLVAAEDEMKRYRAQVSEHFSETSTLLRDLTLQYRNVYEHLADGARTLCPDGARLLAPSLAEALPASASSHAASAEPEEDDDQLDLDLDLAAATRRGDALGLEQPALRPLDQPGLGPLDQSGLGPLLDEAEPRPHPNWARPNGEGRPS
jgi:uncharacterized membrane-anchored protein YhcB (DUF1043 family)